MAVVSSKPAAQYRRRLLEAALGEWDRLEATGQRGSNPLAGDALSQVSGSPVDRKGLDVSSRPVDVAMAAEFLIGALEDVDALGGFRDGLQRRIASVEATAPGRADGAEAVEVWRMLDLLAEAVQAHRETKGG